MQTFLFYTAIALVAVALLLFFLLIGYIFYAMEDQDREEQRKNLHKILKEKEKK